jgi:hypothetical protein
MPRNTLLLREARRASMALSTFPRTRSSIAGHFPSLSHTCPYCSKTLRSVVSRDRHIILQDHCRERHLHALANPITKRRKWKQKQRDAHLTAAAEPPKKQSRSNDSPLPTGPETGPPTGNDAPIPSDEGICLEPCVEKFPISTASMPILDDAMWEPDLREYMKTCGTLADPDMFDIAELLMMTVPKSKDRTWHLKSNLVS